MENIELYQTDTEEKIPFACSAEHPRTKIGPVTPATLLTAFLQGETKRLCARQDQ